MASLNKNNIQKQQILKNKSLNEQISLKIDSFIFKQQIILETFIDNFLNNAEDITDQNQKLNYFVSNMNYINDIVILDSTGGQKAYFGPYYKIDYRDILNKIKQTTLVEKKIFFGGLKKNPARKQLIFTMALPLPKIVDEKDGALLAQIDMKPLEAELAPLLAKDSVVLIFTQNGFLIFSTPEGISTDLNNNYNNTIT